MSTVHQVGTAALPRGLLLARAWADLGRAVAPLSGTAGRPLARTVKLIIDPLVLRPTRHPEFASGPIAVEHVDALRARIAGAGPVLAATAAWFLVLKRERRRAGITEGNPQDLYFQRCFELATTLGEPGPDAAEAAADALAEVHGREGPTVAGLRAFVADAADELDRLLDRTWAARDVPTGAPRPGELDGFLDTCATAPDRAAFDALVSSAAGTRAAAALEGTGAARVRGLTDLDRPARPAVGSAASKNHLPKPFDRTVVERLFSPLTSGFHRQELAGVPALVRREVARTGGAWQLADEPARVLLALGWAASEALVAPATGTAGARLRQRWEREAFVHRVLRMPSAAPEAVRVDVLGVREAHLRRLWVRAHGRELRAEPVTADGVWDLLDGVLRSVVLDQRDRLRTILERRS